MKILFICKYNRFRSKVAEAFFNKLNKNKKYKAQSAGLIIEKPVHKNVLALEKLYGIKMNKIPHSVTETSLRNADKLIIVANNVPPQLFKNKSKKIIVWKIPDTTQDNKKRIIEISDMIRNKVEEVVKRLK